MPGVPMERTLTTSILDPGDVAFGNRLRDRRRFLGISQITLASAANLSLNRLQQYEAGVATISANTLHRLAKALSVGIETFFD